MAKDITLAEMKAHDIENLQHILKKAKTYTFDMEQQALGFIHECLFGTLRKLGVIVNAKTDPRFVDRQLRAHHVKVENRGASFYPDQKDAWRRGLYVYKTDEEDMEREIVAFISWQQHHSSRFLIVPEKWTVKTNVRL